MPPSRLSKVFVVCFPMAAWLQFPPPLPHMLITGGSGLSFLMAPLRSVAFKGKLRRAATEEEKQQSEVAEAPAALDKAEHFQYGGYMSSVPGEILGGKYKLIRELGVGETARVWLCQSMEDNSYSAVKIFRCEPQLVDNMTYESLTVQYVTDYARKRKGVSTIAELRDSFSAEGKYGKHPCLVFEVLGPPVNWLMEQYNFCGISEVPIIKSIIRDTAEALVALEEIYVIHTDLKPENLLLIRDKDFYSKALKSRKALNPCDFCVKLVDFGLSYVQPVHLRTEGGKLQPIERELLKWGNYRKGAVIQTREYRAPEIILGADFGPRADVWSLGCVAFELVTGRFLFDPKASPLVSSEETMDAQHIIEMSALIGSPPTDWLRKTNGVYCDRFFTSRWSFRYNEMARFSRNFEGEVAERLGSLSARTFMSFLRACIAWDPTRRQSPKQLLKHKWLHSIEVR